MDRATAKTTSEGLVQGISLRNILCANGRIWRYVTEPLLVDARCRHGPARRRTGLAPGCLPPLLDAPGLVRYNGRKSYLMNAPKRRSLVEEWVVSIGAVRFPAIFEKSGPERSFLESMDGNLPCPQRIQTIPQSSSSPKGIPRRDLVRKGAPGRPCHRRLNARVAGSISRLSCLPQRNPAILPPQTPSISFP